MTGTQGRRFESTNYMGASQEAQKQMENEMDTTSLGLGNSGELYTSRQGSFSSK